MTTTTERKLPDHGTPARYFGTPRTGNRPPCKCRKCVDAHTKACAARELSRLAGISLRVPSGPVTAHVHKLLDADMSRNSIAIAAGVSATVVSHIASGQNPTTNRTTAEKILAVKYPRPTRDTELMSPLGAQRRLRALYAKAHGPIAICAASGQSDTTIVRTVSYYATPITVATHNAICRAYRTLASETGTSMKALYRAQREGWRDPHWWEDMGHIDDATFNPDAVDRPLKRDELAALRRDEILHLARYGYDPEAIRQRLNGEVSLGTVRDIVREHRTGQRRDRKQAAA